MRYELHLFERIISGDLSPFADELQDPLKYNRAIREENERCFSYTVAAFKKAKDKFSLLDKKVMSSLHPLAEKIITPQQNLFKATDIQVIAPDAYKLLNLKKQNIISVSYSKQTSKTIIYIKESRLCEEIPYAEAKYYYYNNLLKTEVERIKKTIKETVFTHTTSNETEEYIHKQQQAVLNLCYQVIKTFDQDQPHDIYKSAVDFTDIDILNLVYIKLEELLRFFEKNYFNYINKNIQVPYRSALLKIYNINEKLEFVKSTLLNSNIDKGLLKIVYVPLLKLSAITIEERISYRELMYFNLYLDAFYQSIKDHNNVIVESQVRKIVYQVNYNSLELQSYKVEIIKNNLTRLFEVTERIDHLYLCLKITNQRSCRLNISYDPNLPSLKDQLTSWIEEEIKYLNKSLKLSAAPGVTLFSEPNTVKIESGLSVAQLAFFYKLQADVGIINHKTQADIFRHIIENYKTANTSDISFDSVKNKYYNFEGSTIDILKEKVIEILNQLKNHP